MYCLSNQVDFFCNVQCLPGGHSNSECSVQLVLSPPLPPLPPPFSSLAEPAGPNEFVRVAGGKISFGKPGDFPSYGWDNEYGKVEMK